MDGSFCSFSIKGRFFITVLSGVIAAAVAGTTAAEISKNNGITGSSEVVITSAVSAVAAIVPAAIIVCKGWFKNAPPVTIDLRAGLAIAIGGAAGLGLSEGATALGASYPWATTLVGAVGGTLTAVGAAVFFHRCGQKKREVDQPLLAVTDGASA